MSKKQSTPWAGKVVRAIRFLTSQELARESWGVDQMVAALEFTDGIAFQCAVGDALGSAVADEFGHVPDIVSRD